MRRRAQQVDETRQRITEAAVRLHTTVGPSQTTISAVAGEAGVTRLTVYRHFEDLEALFEACMGHWSALNPVPDIAAWRDIEPLEARARSAFGELYAWFASRHEQLDPIYRDLSSMPESAQRAMRAQAGAMAAAIAGEAEGEPASSARRTRVALAGHLVDFRTWRSLVITEGLTAQEAAQVAAAVLCAVDDVDDPPADVVAVSRGSSGEARQ